MRVLTAAIQAAKKDPVGAHLEGHHFVPVAAFREGGRRSIACLQLLE